MFIFLKNLFRRRTHRVRSIEKFIETLKSGDYKKITAKFIPKFSSGIPDALSRDYRWVSYKLIYTAVSPNNQKLICKQQYPFGGPTLIAEILTDVVKAFLLTEKNVKHLHGQLPNIPIEVIMEDDSPITANTFAKAHRDAKRLRLKI